MSFGKNVRRMRQDRGWSQFQLSEKTGIKVNHISKLESGEGDPKLSTLYKFMEAFGCSPDALLMDVEKMSQDAILKQTLERAMKLPEWNKAAIIEVIDGYCRACGMEQAFIPGNNLLRHLMTPRERLPIPEALKRSQSEESESATPDRP